MSRTAASVPLTPSQLRRVQAGLMFGLLLANLDQTVVVMVPSDTVIALLPLIALRLKNHSLSSEPKASR